MKTTRRGPLRLIGTSLVVASLAACTLAACSPSDSAQQAEPPKSTSVTDLVVDAPAEPDSLDPFYRNTPEAQRYYRLVYSSVLMWNEDGSLAPDLAAELPAVSDGGLVYTIKLREGVTFHDGTQLDAKDVVFSYETVMNPENGSSWLSSLPFVKSVKAIDDHTVVIEQAKPYAYLSSRLAMIPIISDETPYKPNDTYAVTGNGSGPYKLDSLKRGDAITLVRNEDFYGKPYKFKTITLKVVPEEAARVARLTNGDSHIAPQLPAEQVALVKKRGANAETIANNTGRLFLYVSMNKDRPTSNIDFRLAIANAIDRGKIVEQVYQGAARANSTDLTYGVQYHDEALGMTFGDSPDLEKAKKHLADSGVELHRDLRIIAFNAPKIVSAMTVLQANLKALGINSTIDVLDIAGLYPDLVAGTYDIIAYESPTSTSSGFAPDYVYGGLRSGSANNYNKFSDPELDRLLDVALVAQSDSDQEAAWKAVQQRDVETQGNIQVVISQTSEGWSKDLVGYRPSALNWLNTLRDVI